jgi:subtilase family serine protease
MARAEFDRGAVDPGLAMGDLVLVLRRGAEKQAAFDRFVEAMYKPESSSYHHWVSAEEIGERFGPDQAGTSLAMGWLLGQGFRIDSVDADQMAVHFSGSADRTQKAFGVRIHHFLVKGESHIANLEDPQIPAELAGVVAGIKGLHNFNPRPLVKIGDKVRFNAERGRWSKPEAGVGPLFKTLDGYGSTIEDVTPFDFAKMYNVLPLWQAATPVTGSGQSVAIVGASNINKADIAAFRTAFGLPVNVPTVTITNFDPGSCPTLDPSCYGDLVENSLDVEWAGAIAKNAKIILVTSSAPTASSDPVYLSANYAVMHKTAPVLNLSYGQCELALGPSGNTLWNNLWQTAAAEGIAVFVASGDSGSPGCDQGEDQYFGIPYGAQFGLQVNGLASTPWNTAVGGTDLNWAANPAKYWGASNNSANRGNALGYVPEAAWNSSCANPLILPAIQADASYLGDPDVADPEDACNFLVHNWLAIANGFGVDLAPLVDTIGAGGGASACTVSNGGYVSSCSGGYAKPSWQAGVPGIPADGKRDLPDVSFFASNGFLGSASLICVSGEDQACTYSATSEPIALEVGGTSVASPEMAGAMALINQKAGKPQGSPNTVFYAMARKQTWAGCSAESVTAGGKCTFNDVDTGTNAMPCAAGTPNCNVLHSGDVAGLLFGYQAASGYDLATGLGSLNVANVVNAWPAPSAGVLTLSPLSLVFGSTQEGGTSASQAITVTNTGVSAVAISASGISITGTNPRSFTQTNNCPASLAATKSCQVNIAFKPIILGVLNAMLSIADNGWESPQTASISGTATTPYPQASVVPNDLTFGTTLVGNSNSGAQVTVTNTGHAALAVQKVSITGTDAASFSDVNGCTASIAPGKSCAITLTFKPLKSGTLTAVLNIGDNAGDSPQTVALGGKAVAVGFAFNGLGFPTTKVGSSTQSAPATLTNAGTTAVTISSVTISGTNATSFTQTNTCNGSIAAKSSCTFTLTFKPKQTGALNATLNVIDNAGNSPQTLTLSGTGD